MLLRALFLALLILSPLSAAHAADNVVMRPPQATQTASASDVVRDFYRSLVSVMKQGDTLGFKGRFDQLKGPITRAFNLADMTRISVGLTWVKISPENKDKLTNAFGDFSVANYANRFRTYSGEAFEVTGEKKGPKEDERIVETTLTAGKDKVGLNYLMRRNEKGAWQVEDVFVNGAISEMATRRSEFGSVVRTDGVDALLRLLQEKNNQLANS
jgi:phospholipid transport system substrate-binding protein